jgi:spore maturation protein CgeB
MNDPLKKYRRRFRLWNNERKLKRERQDYAAKFHRMGLSIPDDDDLRRELKTAFPGIVPKPRGRLNIIAIYHHYNWEDFSLKPGLEKFGTVRHYDWLDEFNHRNKNWRRTGKARMNRALMEKVTTWMAEDRADVIFMYVSGEQVEPETLAALRGFGVPLVNLALNDKEQFVGKIRAGRAFGARDICRYFDLCWTSTEDALMKYRVEGARPIYLPEGANPDIHKPYALDKTIDVSFVGQCYGNRAGVVNALSRQGIAVEAHGYGWPQGPLMLDDMVRLYSRSKINLGFGGVEGHQDTFCLKGRDFEIPMSGGLYLTEDHPELARAFRVGEEILTYSGIEDLIQKILYYLQHPADAETVREKGRERALREHTWEARFHRIFCLLGLLE